MLSRKSLLVGVLALGMLFAGFAGNAFAAGTVADTNVSNKAIVNYEVGSISQPLVESSPTGNAITGAGNGTDTVFKVDKKIIFVVSTTDVAIVQVTPGSSAQVLTYSVSNTGNSTQDFSLTAPDAAAGAFGLTENFNATNVLVRVESGANGGYQPGEDTATFIDELAPGASKTVYVVADIPAQADGDVSSFDLVAQVAVGGGAGKGADITSDDRLSADVAGTVQIVFADNDGINDGDRDGKSSDRDGYLCTSANLTVTKVAAVISDPFNLLVNPKAIPGATVRYTITVSNGGSIAATTVTLVDAQPASTTYTPGTITLGGVGQTDADDSPATDNSKFAAGSVTVVIPTIAAAGSATVTFDVTIN